MQLDTHMPVILERLKRLGTVLRLRHFLDSHHFYHISVRTDSSGFSNWIRPSPSSL